MSIKTVEMYRVECDHDGCDEHPHYGDFYAWADEGKAIEEATNAEWYVRGWPVTLTLCPEHGHRTVCMGDDEECPRRDVTEADDGWMYCPEHRGEGMDEPATDEEAGA